MKVGGGEIPSKPKQRKKSNFIFSDFVLLLVCYLGRASLHKNPRNICVAICPRSSNNLTGLLGPGSSLFATQSELFGYISLWYDSLFESYHDYH